MSRGFDYTTTLGACWSKKEKCFNIYYPNKSDGHEMHDFLKSKDFKDFQSFLDENGYDITTLRLSVKKK